MSHASGDTPQARELDRELLRSILLELSKRLDIAEVARRLDISEKKLSSILSIFLTGDFTFTSQASSKTSESSVARTDGEHIIYVDGASRGNPGLAGAGAIIKKASDGRVVCELRRYLGIVTNNVAEYEALILALEEAVDLGADSLKVHADSLLMVKQIRGEYKVKNEGLKGLHLIAKKLIGQFSSFEIKHVRREFNAEADRLANEAIDLRDV